MLKVILGMRVLLLACFQARSTLAISDEWCLLRGFDPSNLSCDTCALLDESTTLQSLQKEKNAAIAAEEVGGGDPIDIVAECRSCCQAHKVNSMLRPDESLRGKYRYALLTYSENSLDQHGEIKDFIERDMVDVLSFKGDSRFQVKALEVPELDSAHMMTLMGMGRLGGGPPKLMFFEKKKKGGLWSEEDEGEAGEVVYLRGWKREDVKDMLMTLLPNA